MRFIPLFLLLCSGLCSAQTALISGRISSLGGPLPMANILIEETGSGSVADKEGYYEIRLSPGEYHLKASYIGMKDQVRLIRIKNTEAQSVNFFLEDASASLDEITVSGTLTEMQRTESPVAVEVYNSRFFEKNPSPNLFEAVSYINGVRPQINCNVCNTGDIHINGLEGPYTMVLIDGMPIVSGLGTVYGLMGIPVSLIQRTEVVKGPASSLYGSEAVGGLINVITKTPEQASVFSADAFFTSWQELNLDLGFRTSLHENLDVLTGLNLFNYTNPIDNNGDNFTDLTLQKRASVFQKWDLGKNGRTFQLAGRYFYEDRWGGEMQWQAEDRGGDEVYGESIITKRWELMGKYQLPVKEKLMLWISMNGHNQDSYYGDIAYLADQRVGFTQLTWNKSIGRHDLLTGTALRYTYYDDNTPATEEVSEFWLPGIFVQDNIYLSDKQDLLLGMRYDHHKEHGSIFTPRIAYKWAWNIYNSIRVNFGTGFRVVNLFTEEHAALTGAREVLITEELRPEQSYNINLNYLKKWYLKSGTYIGLDASAWYTHFTNQILPDYDTDPNMIIYDNLRGVAVSRGISLNLNANLPNGFSGLLGASWIDVNVTETDEAGQEIQYRPVLTEEWTATWTISYNWFKKDLRFDYTGNLYGPMRLPLLGPLDPRDAYSPWWSIQNIQISWAPRTRNWELYAGIKNLLNFTPADNSIARAFDPFDRGVDYDQNGDVISTPQNPYALSFDPSYVYAPNQGIRGFIGFKYHLPVSAPKN